MVLLLGIEDRTHHSAVPKTVKIGSPATICAGVAMQDVSLENMLLHVNPS